MLKRILIILFPVIFIGFILASEDEYNKNSQNRDVPVLDNIPDFDFDFSMVDPKNND